MKDSRIIYRSQYNCFKDILTDEQKGKLFEALMAYGTEDESPVPADILIPYNMLVNQFKMDDKKYEDKVEKRREAGRMGGIAKGISYALRNASEQEIANLANAISANKCQQMLAKQADKDNDKDNDNVKDKDNVNDKDINREREGVIGGEETQQPQLPVPPDGGAPKTSTLNERKKEFGQSLVPYVETYGSEMIRDFFDYWTEPNKSKTKMHFELERTWDTARRLRTWASRERPATAASVNGKKTIFEEMARLSQLTQQKIIES